MPCRGINRRTQTIDFGAGAFVQSFQVINVQCRSRALHAREHANQRQIDSVIDLASALLFKLLSQRIYQGANRSSLQRHLFLRILFIGKNSACIALHKGIQSSCTVIGIGNVGSKGYIEHMRIEYFPTGNESILCSISGEHHLKQ